MYPVNLNAICWELELERLLGLTTFQLNFYGKEQVDKNYFGGKKSSRKFEKYRRGLHKPSPKTLNQFRNTKAYTAERWLTHDIWNYLGQTTPSYQNIADTLNELNCRTRIFTPKSIKSAGFDLSSISKIGPIENLWRNGSMRSLSALLAIFPLCRMTGDYRYYSDSNQAAYHLLILHAMEEPLRSIRDDLVRFFVNKRPGVSLLSKFPFYQRASISVIHEELEKTLLALENRDVPIETINQKSTAIYRLWRCGVINKGLSVFHRLSNKHQKKICRDFFYGHRTKWGYRNFGLNQLKPSEYLRENNLSMKYRRQG